VDFCRYYANEARRVLAVQDLPGPTGESNQLHLHGRGVILCISPWNFPLAIFIGQISAALVTGNSVIAKPARQTSLIAAYAVQLFRQAGIPEATLQLLPGRSEVVGTPLISDPRISGVLLTGSTETARKINQTLAARPGPIVPFIAETGGQNAMIVDSTALPEQVVNDVINSAFGSAGQRCSALRVLFIQEDVADKILVMLAGAMAELVIGDPSILATDIGPVIDEGSKAVLEAHAEKMVSIGKLIYKVELPPELKKQGSFFAPQAYEIESLDQLTHEVFGPILHVIRYKRGGLEGVIDDINNTGFGLTFGLHTRINETAEYICERVYAGNMYINRNTIGAVVGVQPFGGEGLSGTGPKAGGPHYLLRLCKERTVTINTTAMGGNASLMALGGE
jgi:RHH-type proline utilization regulon transcriptional repressor/proline dehydrogenase/delta 1-pyrroline-5-carboxylate dehydrogenase